MSRLLFILPVLFIACNTQPKTADGELKAAEEGGLALGSPVEEKPAEIALVVPEPQDGAEEESYEEMFNEVKTFIESLNSIIQTRNYNKWRDALSEELRKEISSPGLLAEVSQKTPLKKRGIVLRKPEDYFYIVVVPSRANSQVDEIEIVNNNRVKAYYYSENKRLRLYELERRGDSWTIIQ